MLRWLKSIDWRAIVGAVLLTIFLMAVFEPSQCPSVKNGCEGQKAVNNDRETSWINSNTITAGATAVIALFTIVLVLVTNRQARLTRESIELANKEFNTTHRPRIRVRAISYPRIRQNVPVTFTVTVVNAGDNDATITAIGITAIEHDGEDGFVIELLAPTDPAKVYLQSGARHTFERTAKASSDSSAWGAIEAGAHTFIVVGDITYSDKTGIARQTGFAREWNGKRGGYSISKIYAEAEYED